MTTRHILGVDGGGTKTECALATLDTRTVAQARGGPSNHETVGYEAAAQTVADLVTELLAAAGTTADTIAGACFAMAGMDLEPDRDDIRNQIVTPLHLSCPHFFA